MSYELDLQRLSKRGISVTGNTPTLIAKTANKGMVFVPHSIIIRTQALSGITLLPSITIGTNGPGYNNILTTLTLTSMNAPDSVLSKLIDPGKSVVPANSNIYIKSTGIALGSWTIMVDLFGYYTK